MFCSSCGNQIPDDSAFCLKCGRPVPIASLAEKTRPDRNSSRTRNPKANRALVGIAAILVLASGFVYLKSRPLTLGEVAQVKISPGDLALKYANAVVVLENYNDQGQQALQGSGFICSADGVVLTNYHVIRGASRITVRTRDQSIHEIEYVAGFDTQHDIAAVKIAGENLRSVHLGDSSVVKTGDHVTVLGAPLGLESTLSDGIISAVREAGSLPVFQTSAPISHGSSGGPLFDDYGNVIALAVSSLQSGENLNFAVPINYAKQLLKSEHRTSFAELLAETTVHQPVLASSTSLPPQVTTIDVAVPPQGGTLVGSFSIAGGAGNDLGMLLTAENGGVVWNGGIIHNAGEVNLPLRGGRYKLVLNNKMGPFWVSWKTLSGAIDLKYYR